MRRLSQERSGRTVPRAVGELLLLPPSPISECSTRSQGNGFPPDVPELPFLGGYMAESEVRSCEVYRLRFDGNARDARLRSVSRWWPLQRDACQLLRLSRQGLQRHQQSEPFTGWFCARVRNLSLYGHLERSQIRSLQNQVPAYGNAHQRALHVLPHQREICRHADGLRLVPHH